MSGFITSAGENYILDLVANRREAVPAYYVSLIRNKPPSQFVTGYELDEPNYADYSRARYENSALFWTASSGEIRNTQQITFPVALATWGTIRYWALTDASNSGNVFWAGSMEAPIYVEEGSIALLPPGSLILRTTSYINRVSL